MQPNPFLYGSPVPPDRMIGRRTELRRIVGRILTQGQSTALVGEPRLGKSSLLHYLYAPAKRTELYGTVAESLLFCLLDCHTLAADWTPAHFWQRISLPIEQCWQITQDSELARAWQDCQKANFTPFALDTLFQTLHRRGQRLVVLLDEFDALLHHPKLSSAEFFGGLRSLASTSQGALALVIASRLPIERLNAETHHFNPTGSPYFNIYAETTLAAWNESEVDALLALAFERFTLGDRLHLRHLVGRHPYLLQAAAAAIWDAHEEKLLDEKTRHQHVSQRIEREHAHHFADTWRVWRPELRQAFTCVALVNAKGAGTGKEFDINSFLEALAQWQPELKELERVGVVFPTKSIAGGWGVAQPILLAWLWDELRRAVRDENELGKWLKQSEVEGYWLEAQRKQAINLLRVIGTGSASLAEMAIRAYAMGSAMGEKVGGN